MNRALLLTLLVLPACYRDGVLRLAASGTDTGTSEEDTSASGMTSDLTDTTESGEPITDTETGADPSSAEAGAEDMLVIPADAPEITSSTLKQIKTLRLAWSAVEGATQYEVHEQQLGAMVPTLLTTSAETLADLYLFFYASQGAEYTVRACNDAGCGPPSSPFALTGNLADGIGLIKSEVPSQAGAYGTSVAISDDGTRLAVGAPGEAEEGRVYVYAQADGQWVLAGTLSPTNQGGGSFGAALAMSGDGQYLAVGDPSQSEVSLYALEGLDVLQVGLQPAAGEEGDEFGASLAMDGAGAMLVVGAPLEDSSAIGVGGDANDNGSSSAGAVYAFERTDGDVWALDAYIKPTMSPAGARFGTSVAVSAEGDMIVGGAPGQGSGIAYVFAPFNTVWQQQDALSSGELGDQGDQFGYAVATNGGYIAVGAPYEDSGSDGLDSIPNNISTNAGAAYVFDTDATLLHYVKASNSGLNDFFGSSVALSDELLLAVGAPYEDSDAVGISEEFGVDTADSTGAVYLVPLAEEGGAIAYLKGPQVASFGELGQALGLSANTLVVGAPGDRRGDAGISPEIIEAEVIQSGALYLY